MYSLATVDGWICVEPEQGRTKVSRIHTDYRNVWFLTAQEAEWLCSAIESARKVEQAPDRAAMTSEYYVDFDARR